MKRYIIGLIALFCISIAFYNPSKARNERISVVTTTAQIADIAKNLKSDAMDVTHLMGTGVDPHIYRPTRSDIVKLRNADIIIYNGFHLEGQMVELLETLAKEKTVLSIGDEISNDLLLEGGTATYDPHIWMNVGVWIEATKAVEKTFSDFAPDLKDHFNARAQDYTKQLTALDQHIKDTISTIPDKARTLITAHDAFGYFGDAYGIEVIGIQGLSTESEAGLKRMEELVDLVSANKIPAIFTETSVNDRNIKALIEGAKNKGHDVALGGSLYSDAMGKEGSYEGTYIGMMDHNLRTITKALGGTATAFISNPQYAQQ